MIYTEETLKCNFSFADLLVLAMNKHSFMQRDLADLVPFNITPLTLDEFMLMITQLQDCPTDVEYLANQTLATGQKDAEAERLREQIRPVVLRAVSKWGAASPQHRRFGSERLANKTDDQLVVCAMRVIRAATVYLPLLADQGLTQLIIDELKTQADAFSECLMAQTDAITDRDMAANDRIKKANTVYERMVELCAFAKQTFWNNHEAKYNDYLMPDEGGTVPKEEVRIED